MQNELYKRIISSIILLPLSIFIIVQGSILLNLFLLVCFFIALYEWNMMSRNFFLKLLGIFFLVYSFYSVHQIRNIFNYDYYYILFVIGICIATDIGGFIFGKLLKGPKITKISPNKTYAGMIGGYFLSLVCLSIIIEHIDYLGDPFKFFLITLFLSTVSQAGDIFISNFKRKAGIKNTGSLIPGHGGLLDRIDGMIFAVPTLYLVKTTGFLYS